MSNTLAIAIVTSTIRHVLHESLGGTEAGAVGGADVTTLRPHQLLHGSAGGSSPAGLNVYLYDVTWSQAHDPYIRPLPGSTRHRGQHPVAALDLHYLVTAYGDDATLEPQRLLARAARALASTPVFTQPVVAAAIAEYGIGDTAFLADDDLSAQPEPVKLMPAHLSIDELSKLWRALATPYLLSLAYTASAVHL